MSAPKLGPGIYKGLSDDRYHSDCATALSFSASDFRCLALESPAHFFERHWLNPAHKRPDSRALSFGRAAHYLMLEPKMFAERCVVAPFDDFKTKEAREWRDVVAAGKTVLKQRDMDTVSAMCEAMRRTPQVAKAFTDGSPELSLFWEPRGSWWPHETPIMFKSRPDWTPNQRISGVALEYKTAESAHPEAWSKAFFNYGYDIQAAMIDEAYRACYGQEITIGHVVQEKEPPYVCQVYVCTEDALKVGRKRLKRGIAMLAACLPKHLQATPPHMAWPGYFSTPVTFDVPAWLSNKESDR